MFCAENKKKGIMIKMVSDVTIHYLLPFYLLPLWLKDKAEGVPTVCPDSHDRPCKAFQLLPLIV